MKIALVSTVAGFVGGIEKHVHDLAVGLRARQHHVTLLHAGRFGRDQARYLEAFDDAAELGQRKLTTFDVAYVHKAAGFAVERKTPPVLFAAHDHDATCVRSHRYLPLTHTPCHRAPGLACVAHGCCVVRSRAGIAPIAIRNPFRLRAHLRSASRTARFVACSHYIAESLKSAGVSPHRVDVLHPSPPEDAAPLRPRPEEPLLVVVAQLVRGKGVDLAIRATALLGPDVQLTIVGEGPQRGELEALANSVAPSRVRFLGALPPPEVTRCYDLASVAIVPSRWPEPFGMVGIEAMRRARPVVGSAHGGIPEWLADGKAGKLFTPGDAAALARATARLLADRDAGERARQHAARFSFDAMVEKAEWLLERASS